MSETVILIVLPLLLLLIGGLAGMVAGLFGVGGGIIMVPLLSSGLMWLGVDQTTAMQVAVATSLAAIIPTSLISFRTHWQHGAVDMPLLREMVLFISGGALVGSLLAGLVPVKLLAGAFSLLCLLFAWHYLTKDRARPARDFLPSPLLRAVLGLVIGLISAMLGIGGGLLGVIMLTAFGLAMHRAVSTASVFGLLVAVPASIIYALHAPPVGVPFGTIGLVHPLGLLLLTPTAMVMARLGAKWAHTLSAAKLRFYFAILLLIIASKMAVSALWH